MKTDFICPQCQGHLLVSDKIILTAITRQDKKSGMILLSPKLGDYATIQHPGFEIKKGDEVDYYCPICHANLSASDVDQNLVRIFMVDEKDDRYEIYFSGVSGEKCTYKVSDKKVEKFGESAEKYYKYFMARKI